MTARISMACVQVSPYVTAQGVLVGGLCDCSGDFGRYLRLTVDIGGGVLVSGPPVGAMAEQHGAAS